MYHQATSVAVKNCAREVNAVGFIRDQPNLSLCSEGEGGKKQPKTRGTANTLFLGAPPHMTSYMKRRRPATPICLQIGGVWLDRAHIAMAAEIELSEPARLLLLASLLAKDGLISHNGELLFHPTERCGFDGDGLISHNAG